MILQRPFHPHQPGLTHRPDFIDDRGGLEPDRFFPVELVNPARRIDALTDDASAMFSLFTPRWWPAPR